MRINKKKTISKAKSITIDFLDALLAGVENFASIMIDRRSAYRILYGHYENTWTYSKICKHFHSLKQRGYVEIVKTAKGESVQFTNKAKLKVLDQIANRAGWDGKYRFVSFDIPEYLKRNRNAFRQALKRIGFRQIQKSLWVCNRNVGELVELAAYEYGVEKYIAYLVSDRSDIDGLIGKMFATGR